MKKQGLFLILLALVLASAGWYLMKKQANEPYVAPKEQISEARTFSWRFDTTENEGDMAPRTTVALITGDRVYNLGGHMGTCAEIATENLLEGEVSGVLCWWAGAGTEIGVFKEGEAYIVKAGAQEESPAETDGFRGDFKEVVTLQ